MAGRHRRSRPYGDWWLCAQLVRLLVESLIVTYGDKKNGPGPHS